MVLEVMGRHAGWIALHGGFAGSADVILIPEIPFEHAKVADEVMRRDKTGAKSTMIVVSEGASPKEAAAPPRDRQRRASPRRYRRNRRRRSRRTHGQGSSHLPAWPPSARRRPTTLDRILGTCFGIKAIQLVAEKKFGTMVSYQNYLTIDFPFRTR